MVGGGATDYTFRLLGSGLATNVFNINLTTGITSYNYAINVTGSVTATSFIKTGGTSSQYLMADGSTSTGGGGSSQWITSGSNIYYSAGKVGVGLNAAFPTALTVYESSASTTTIDSGLTIGNGNGNLGVFAGIRFGTYGDVAGSVSYPKQFIVLLFVVLRILL